jgi:hypothetical protein
MSTFPRLRTGAVAQFPAGKALEYRTEVFRFLDGTEQRYRAHKGAIRRWAVRLDLLDDEEVSRLRDFFVSRGGASGDFEFEDPWDGTVHPKCSLEADELIVEFIGEGRARTALVVREDRS